MNEWDEWKKKAEKANAAKAPPPVPPKTPKAEIPHLPLTENQLMKLKRLRKVSTGGNGQAARFIQQYQDATLETLITERQAFYVEILWYRYRRQLGINPPKPEGYV
jgi:hypothetical protein